MKITATWLEKAQNSFSRSNKSQNREETGKGEVRESWRREKKIPLFTLRSGAEQIPETKLFKSNIIG